MVVEEEEGVLVGGVHVELDQELDVIVIDHRTRSFERPGYSQVA